MPLESIADKMGTSDKSLGDPTIQVFLEIPEISEDIPTTGSLRRQLEPNKAVKG
jgi:hypothetical protein